MSDRNRKAVVSEDGCSIEVYADGKAFTIDLHFSVWAMIDVAKERPELGTDLDCMDTVYGT